MKKFIFFLLLSSLVVGQSETASTPMVWWVDHKNGDDSNSGATEETAVKTVYKAMKNIGWFNGDTIKVKPALNSDGTLHYYDFKNEEINLNTSNNFMLIGTGGADSTIFDARNTNRHFTFDDGQSSETIIKGITFKNGYGDNWPGAGSIFLHRQLHIQFIDCTWENNSTNGQEGGGAIIIREGATPSFTGCTFKGNYVNNTDGGNNGGAVRIQWPNSKAELESTVKFKKTKFIDNYLKVKHSAYGGAVASERNVEFENCLFVNNSAIANNGGTGSEAWGGAISFDSKYWNGSSYDGGVMKIVNSTFHGNYIQTLSSNYGDMRAGTINYGRWDNNANSKTYIFNTIVSGSKVLIEQTERVTTSSDYLKNEVIGTGNTSGFKLTLDHSNIQGSTGMSWSGDNTYEVEPVYKDTANGDFSLSDKSPVIGAGVATWSDEGNEPAPTEDILGNARPNPSGSNPDMGAYENSLGASTAPLPVSGLTAKRATQGASLSWSVVKESLGSSTDASNIEYQIYQNGTNVAQTTSTSYSVTGLTNGTTYSFTVSAKNTSTGIEGAQSGAETATPRYRGPKWYVATSDGKSLSDTTINYNLGSSSSPINHLSNGIEIAAAGDTIVMMKGTHTGSNNRGINENGNKSFIIMGDPDYSADQTIIDAGGRDRHFTFDNSEDTTFQIIGLTLYNGKTTTRGGGSIKIENAAVKLKNVIFLKNYSTGEDASTSGAIWMQSSGATTIESCTFDGNYIYGEEMGYQGGAIFAQSMNKGTDTLKIKNSIFKNNYVKAKDDANGGAIAISHYQAVIENNLFYDNYVYSALGSPNSRNASGGAVYLYNPNYWDNNTQSSKSLLVLFRNNTVVNNWVTSEKSDSYLDGAGVEFSGHDAGVYYSFNNIIWGNKLLGRTNHNQIYLNYNENNIKFNDDYNDIQNLEQHNQYSRFGDYSVSYEPEFSDSASGDFTLTDKSLLLGSGTASFDGFAAPAKDILGNVRPNPAGSNPDMGAYENSIGKSPYPKQVQNLTAVGGSGQVTLNWDALADADSVYKVYKHTSAFSVAATYLVGATSAKTSPHETTYTITGLDNAARYYFRVTGVSKLGYEGTASATVDITPKFSGPIWWVATDGSDNNEGSATSPFSSIGHAIENVSEGDTITIKPGTYGGSKNRNLDSEGKNLVIMSQYPATWDSVIIDAQEQDRHFIYNSNSGNTVSASKTKLIGLTLKNGLLDSQNDGGPRGASITLEQSASVTFEKIYFLNNSLYNNTSTSAAGAVWMNQPGSEFYYCRFENNKSNHRKNGDSQSTGAIGIDGEGTESENKYTLIDGCEFINNQGRNEGGAINARHNTVIQNSLFYKNSVANGGGGGAIAAMPQVSGQGHNYDTYLHVINCTFIENSATGQGGAIQNHGSNGPIIFNSIFMNNRRYSEQSTGELNDFMGGADNNKPKVNYVRVDESTVATTDRAEWGSNIYFDPPAFTDTTKENFTLTSASTLIGTGTTSFEGVSSPTKDINGNMRPNPSGSNPDLGAYENSLAESPFPSQVKNVTATIGSQSVNLSWDANSETDIEKYLIYMSETSGFEPTSEDNIGESATNSFSAKGLANNMEYHFRVAAVDSNGYRGTFSQEVFAMPQYLGPTWWVSNDGSNTGDGSEFNPIANLGEALMRVNSGDTIAIKAGLYTGDANAGFKDDQIFQQQDGLPKPSMELTIKGVTGDPGDVVFDGQNNGRQRFFIFQRRDPYNDKIRIENLTFQNEFHNGDTNDGPAGGGAIAFSSAHTELVFENVIFKKNQAHQPDYHAGGGAVMIQVAEGKKPPMFINCRFIDNRVQPKDGSGNDNAMGGAVCIQPGWDGPGTDAFQQPAVIFDQCYFESNQAHSSNISNGWRSGSAIQSQANIIIRNSVFVNNHFGGGGESIDATVNLQPQYNSNDGATSYSGRAILINNTFHDNRGERIISFGSSDHESARLFLYSNIFSEYTGRYEAVEVYKGSTGVEFHAGSNLFDEAGEHYTLHIDIQIIDGGGDVIGDPKFKGEAIKNFELTPSSPAIDAGINSLPNGSNDELGGGNAPVFDIRGYYRVGTPDLGAYEFGASKYILAMVDDIAEDKDTTFVELGQELKITVTTGDIDGNLVSSNENMTWNIFPNQKYVKYVSGDRDTDGGDASATFEVTSQIGGKGFRFRIEAGIGDAFMRSGMYVIEELVTGAPPPVANLTISPSDWTSDPNFTLNWETPTWAAQRGLIGAVVEITDGINVYNEYMGFPSGDTLTNYSFTAPEAGQYDAYLWLIDELGNEDQDSAMSVTAYFDNVTPEAFQIHYPESLEEIIYTSDKPRFYWEESGDYPSGIKEWRLFINNNLYGTYNFNDVTFDNGDVYIDAENALADGYYDWHLEAVDYAGNSTMSSDTGHFGVDLSPPNISHPSPLGTIDEGSTTPTINVSFSDGASGVRFGRLHYRRSGSGSGFVTLDLLGGPVSIPGSDVKENGLEYWIDTEDNVGNYDAWPGIGELHSVRVQTERNITTADNWSNGIPGGTDSTNYLFFSIPFEVSGAKSAITSLMGPPDEFNYRLFAYNNGWQEDPSSVTMGNAYFFIFDPDKYTETPNLSFDFGQGVSTATDPPYQVNVTPGQWKFFGSPYNYNVPLDNVYTEDEENIHDAGSIYTWSGSWSNAGSSLQPWKGYVFKSGGATELNIDARGSGFGKMAKAMNTDDYPMDADEWIIDMIATTGNARDELNAVGVRNMAEDGYDRLDEFEPPAVMGDITLRIDNRDREESPDLYAMDIRKPNEAGHYWDLQIFAPTNGQRTYLTFDGLGYIPEEYDIFLINKTTKQAKNLEWESSYRFANTGSESHLRQDLRLVVGTKQFVEDNNAGVNLYPDAFTLAQNYPNPFNPQTSIMISLEQDAQLNLIIYNLLGEEITRLAMNEHRPAGYYTFIWNGTNAMGSKVSTGVYFYHAMIQDAQGKVVLNKTRKMIFLK